MPHALAQFVREQMDARGWRNTDLESASGLSRQLVSKVARDSRDRLTRLPDKATLEGLARAFNVPVAAVATRAVEALGVGLDAGDFVYGVREATDDELITEVARRLRAKVGTQAVALQAVDAARPTDTTGLTLGDRKRRQHDEEATAPDPEGPEEGA